jgi:hypothetical protein
MSARPSHRSAGSKALERTLRATAPNGARTALLVLGNGVHVQAAREAGLDDPDPWLAAIRRLATDSGIPDIGTLPGQEPLRWDALVRQAAAALKLRASAGDDRFRTSLVKQLISTQETRRPLPLFGRLLGLHFDNILSFNVDRTLALHADGQRVAPREPWLARDYEYDLVSHREGLATRIWYPYGNTSIAAEIALGTKTFARQLEDLEDARTPMMNDWVESRVGSWTRPGAKARTTLMSPERFYEHCRKEPIGWYRMFFAAPLVIIGASLPLEDWPLWWLLHQRARNLAVFPTSPPTFFLTAKGEAHPHLYGRSAEIELVEFPSHDALWKFVLRE